MAVIDGTIEAIDYHGGPFEGRGNLEAWLIAVSFPAVLTADTVIIQDVGDVISAKCKDGKTRIVKGGVFTHPGRDAAGVEVYMGATIVKSSADLTSDLVDAADSSIGAGASAGAQLIVTVGVS